jgi:hypothetical protein
MTHRLSGPIINAGCLLFFAEPLESVRHNDVLDSLLYVQLAASKRYGKFTEFEHWKDTWFAASSRFGWALQHSEHISQPLARGISGSVWDLSARALRSRVDEMLVADAEQQVRQPPQPQALDLLVSQTSQARSDSDKSAETTLVLQVGMVEANGNLTLSLLHFTTRQPLTAGFLFEPLDAASLSGNVELTICSMRLIDQVYGQFREAFSIALQERRTALTKPWQQAPDVEQS